MVPLNLQIAFFEEENSCILQIYEVVWGFLNFSHLDADYENTIDAYFLKLFHEIFLRPVCSSGKILKAGTLIVDNLSLFEKQIFTLEIESSSTKSKLFEE